LSPCIRQFFFFFLLLFSYDLPPFLATLVLVFLLADASPFLLDFFLVAIILPSYEHTIINDLLLILVRMENSNRGIMWSKPHDAAT
jgi:hypothetical protein